MIERIKALHVHMHVQEWQLALRWVLGWQGRMVGHSSTQSVQQVTLAWV